jgi:hypothetical protein
MPTFTLFEDIHGFKMCKTFEEYKKLCEAFIGHRTKEHPPTEYEFTASNPNKVSKGFGNQPSIAERCVKRWLKKLCDEGKLKMCKKDIEELKIIINPEQISIRDDEEIIPAGTIIKYEIPDWCKNKDKMIIRFID